MTQIQPYQPRADVVYSLQAVTEIAGVPRRRVIVYCRHGLVRPLADPVSEEWQFDDEAIRIVRQVERLRSGLGMNLQAIKLVMGLMGEVEQLRREVRFLRGM